MAESPRLPHSITTRIDIAVEEDGRSSSMGAFLAQPADGGTYPGVIVGFELFGLTAHIRDLTTRIAGLGYTAIAPDFYHRTAPGIELEATAEGRARGFEQLHQLTRDQALSDVRATMRHLRETLHVGAVGMVGFSVGGHIAYLAATQLDLGAAVVFYPGWLTTSEIPLSQPAPTLTLTPGIRGRILFLVGELDALIPTEQRETIEAALREAQVPHEMIVYPGVSHGFFCDERPSFHAEAAADAWHRTHAVLTRQLTDSQSPTSA